MRKLFLPVLAIALMALGMLACNKSTESVKQPADNFDRKALLTHVADNIIVPSYTNFQNVFGEMKTAANNFTATPDATTLSTLRTKWRAAYIAWQQVELFNFGPADNVLLRNHFNIYPTDVARLRGYVTTGSYNLEELANNKVQGFPALDYLLNGSGNNNQEILANYTGSDAAKWKKYLTDVVTIMNAKSTKVLSDWTGSYRQQFTANAGTGAGSPMSLMVNEYIMNFERFLRAGKFGIPAGVMSGTPAPEKVEAFYTKDLGKELAKTALTASRDFYLGKAFGGNTTGPGLNSYLKALGTNNTNVATLATNIESQFSNIDAKINSLNISIYDAIVNNRPAVLAVYDEFQKQVRYLKVDLTSAIGITISYTDNDGD